MNEFFHLRKSFSSKNDFPTANTFDRIDIKMPMRLKLY